MTDVSCFSNPQAQAAAQAEKSAWRAEMRAISDPFAPMPAYGGRPVLDALGAAVVGTERIAPFPYSAEEAVEDLQALLVRAFPMALQPEDLRLVQQCHGAISGHLLSLVECWEEARAQEAQARAAGLLD